jgi:hypothetical protein
MRPVAPTDLREASDLDVGVDYVVRTVESPPPRETPDGHTAAAAGTALNAAAASQNVPGLPGRQMMSPMPTDVPPVMPVDATHFRARPRETVAPARSWPVHWASLEQVSRGAGVVPADERSLERRARPIVTSPRTDHPSPSAARLLMDRPRGPEARVDGLPITARHGSL